MNLKCKLLIQTIAWFDSKIDTNRAWFDTKFITKLISLVIINKYTKRILKYSYFNISLYLYIWFICPPTPCLVPKVVPLPELEQEQWQLLLRLWPGPYSHLHSHLLTFFRLPGGCARSAILIHISLNVINLKVQVSLRHCSPFSCFWPCAGPAASHLMSQCEPDLQCQLKIQWRSFKSQESLKYSLTQLLN